MKYVETAVMNMKPCHVSVWSCKYVVDWCLVQSAYDSWKKYVQTSVSP